MEGAVAAASEPAKRMKRIFVKMVWVVTALLVGLASIGYAYVQHPKFGTLPEGERLARIERSPNYADGAFQNVVPTPVFTDESSATSVVPGNTTSELVQRVPEGPIPSVKTELKELDGDHDVVIWMGHSSYFVQLRGKRILIDPVFSSNAAPVPYANEAFAGTNLYAADDMPDIDYLLITHDHYDHLDYPSIKALQPKVREVIAGLGIGAYFEQWGYPGDRLREADWGTALEVADGLIVHVLPARHYSGRLLSRNKTLWVAFALETPGRRLFFSGDSGYGPHLRAIGDQFGGFDLAALDSGQYDRRWAYIHMTPEEAAQAAEDLRATALLPAHVGRFAIANHPWDEPFERVSAANEGKRFRLVTPMIGQPLDLDSQTQRLQPWWVGVQ